MFTCLKKEVQSQLPHCHRLPAEPEYSVGHQSGPWHGVELAGELVPAFDVEYCSYPPLHPPLARHLYPVVQLVLKFDKFSRLQVIRLSMILGAINKR